MRSSNAGLAIALAWLCACGSTTSVGLEPRPDGGLPDGGLPDGGFSDGGDAGDAGVTSTHCQFNVSANVLDFGDVTPGTTAPAQNLTIANIGSVDCIVQGVNLGAGTDSAFVLTAGEVTSQLLSPASGGPYPSAMVVSVAFDPQAITGYMGALYFEAGDPQGTLQPVIVQLVGQGSIAGGSCFVLPTQLSFGVVGVSNGQYCASGKRKVVFTSGCPFDVTIESATIVPADSPWSLSGWTFPLVIKANQAAPALLITFRPPEQPGTYSATLQVQTDLQAAPYSYTFSATVATPNTQTDTFTGAALFYSRQFPLEGNPVPSSLAVTLNGAALPATDWSYNGFANTVVLGADVALQPSDVLAISYWLTCQ